MAKSKLLETIKEIKEDLTTAGIFPVLYGTSSAGKIKVFEVSVDGTPQKATMLMRHGYEGGKMAEARREYTKGLNIGKKNETTAFEQAVSEARSKWNKKKDEGYSETKRALKMRKLILPMLAKTYSDIKNGKEKGYKKYIKFPCYVQPKLDGVRCISDSGNSIECASGVNHFTRGGKKFTVVEHLDGDSWMLVSRAGGLIDGEIYNHNEISFQDICSAVKKRNHNTPKLKYYIYDLAIEGIPFERRNQMLKDAFKDHKFNHVVLVPTYEAKNEEEIIAYHEQFVKDGYEGIIIRNKDGVYTFKHRSKDLQKWKNFHDDEFEVIGGKEATGEDAGTIVFILKTKDGKEFECRPRGSREQRREWFQNLKSLISKKLTVRFQGISDEGIPRFPVGICIRDYEGK